jgi:hypothetical protein
MDDRETMEALSMVMGRALEVVIRKTREMGDRGPVLVQVLVRHKTDPDRTFAVNELDVWSAIEKAADRIMEENFWDD